MAASSQAKIIDHQNIRCRNFGGLFNNKLYSDLVLIVGEERFKVHKAILTVQSEYFRMLLNNGMNESNKADITIQEPNVKCFEKILKYVYSGEMKFDGTNEAIELMKMANKYLFAELQSWYEDYLGKILSMENFCPIYSAAFGCSASNLLAQCFRTIDSNPSKILKLDGFSELHVLAIIEIIGRKSFESIQSEVFVAVSKWIAVNKDANATPYDQLELSIVLLSNIRLEAMPMDFLLKTVRPSQFFSATRILDAVAVVFEKERIGKLLATPMQISVTILRRGWMTIHEISRMNHYPLDTIAQVKAKLASICRYLAHRPISLRQEGSDVPLQDDRTLESYGIRNGACLVVIYE